MRTAILQFQDVSGTWMTVSTNVDANDTVINMRLNELQKRYVGKRVRAIDSQSGAVVDIR
jgi:hypothetical protein